MKDESRSCLLLEVQFILENDDFHVKSCFDNFKKSWKKSSWKEDKNMKQYIEYQERERERRICTVSGVSKDFLGTPGKTSSHKKMIGFKSLSNP